MKPLVDEQLMESTWNAVGAMSEPEVRQRQSLCGKEQQELTAFVLAYTSELPPEALGLALYAHFVVVEAFRRCGTRFRKLKPAEIERAWKDNSAFVNGLRAAGVSRTPFQLQHGLASEPAVMQYVVDALTEQTEDDPISITEEDFWRILQVLKTVSDSMHFAQRPDGSAT